MSKPDRKFLDAEFPDTPVMIREHSCHVFLNTKGLELAGYTQEDFDANRYAGYFVRKNGEITGSALRRRPRKPPLQSPN
jgi:predicted amidohydrolase YtcJ